MRFQNRDDAGRQLASSLTAYRGRADVLVLGLPRGGVPVASAVATALAAPLDVFLVRKLGLPGQEELAMGAIAQGGVEVLSDVVRELGIPRHLIDEVAVRERLELDRRDRLYRGDRQPPAIRDRTVILVDDGLATGATMEAAILALRARQPAKIVAAAPVGARETCTRLRRVADDVVCPNQPESFRAVGQWYDDFRPTSDDDVRTLLERPAASPSGLSLATMNQSVHIPVDGGSLDGDLSIPATAKGLVLFAHGSGSSRHSPRNQFVAGALQSRGLGTLLIDLLTEAEEAIDQRTARLRFDIGLLADRLATAIDWLKAQDETRGLPVGLFGASTGAGAALVAASIRPSRVAAVVSRGGRPDLAGSRLAHVQAATLLIVGGRDTPVIDMNQEAMVHLRGLATLEIIPGATHLFEEPGTLERVADVAADFFSLHLPAFRPPSSVRGLPD